MRHNPQRRTALLDAAIEVLARQGSRGLTLRAIDAAAGVPVGTATNYFKDRDDLLVQVLHRTRERFAPDPHVLAQTMGQQPSAALVTELMHQLLDRMRADRDANLAMLELRLEATRRPGLQAELDAFLVQEHRDNLGFHEEAGLPGDRTGVALLYFGMLGLVVDELTAPAIPGSHDSARLVTALVERVLAPGD